MPSSLLSPPLVSHVLQLIMRLTLAEANLGVKTIGLARAGGIGRKGLLYPLPFDCFDFGSYCPAFGREERRGRGGGVRVREGEEVRPFRPHKRPSLPGSRVLGELPRNLASAEANGHLQDRELSRSLSPHFGIWHRFNPCFHLPGFPFWVHILEDPLPFGYSVPRLLAMIALVDNTAVGIDGKGRDRCCPRQTADRQIPGRARPNPFRRLSLLQAQVLIIMPPVVRLASLHTLAALFATRPRQVRGQLARNVPIRRSTMRSKKL